MIGNVWEWVWDWYAPYAGPAIDPTGPDVPPAMPGRVIRGMSWFGVLFPLARSASRQQVPADTRNNDLGLRPVRTIL